MQFINLKRNIIVGLFVLLFSVAGQALTAGTTRDDLQPPYVPCAEIQAPTGNKVFYKVYAVGVQIYRWSGTKWDFVAPVANLYADINYRAEVGFHYAGPTWQSNGGGKVIASRAAGCTPDPTAIPWLLLRTVSTDRVGIFRQTTYIQRVTTAGGLAPTTPGSSVGAEARVPYTAEYYFYRSERIDGGLTDF